MLDCSGLRFWTMSDRGQEAYLRPEEPDSTSLNISVPKCHQVADDDGEPEGSSLEDGVGYPKLCHIKGANAKIKERVEDEEGIYSDVRQKHEECE